MRKPPLIAVASLALTFVAFVPSPSPGCAAIGPHPVHILSEDAIIVWDAAAKTQHFIRRANFHTLSPDFGFLVPTPTPPKLSEVGDAGFQMLTQVIAPKVRHVWGGVEFVSIMGCIHPGAPAPRSEQAGAAVQVLDQAKVGGFDAVVLAADDPVALEKWLKDHGYPSSPELSGWLGPYLSQKWAVTAFKIITDAKTGRAVGSDKAVKMTFATEKPFFPYREPETKQDDQKGGNRVLRVYFLAAQRESGTLGSTPWHAETVYAESLAESRVTQLASDLDLPRTAFPDTVWLTAFKDSASPRPGSAEVFFEPATDSASVHPPDVIVPGPKTPIPLGLVVVGVMIVVAFVLKRRARLERTKSRT